MWPFKKSDTCKRIATATVNGVTAIWTEDGWSFSDGKYDYTMYECDCFDSTLANRLPNVQKWIEELGEQIDSIINEHVGDWRLDHDDRAVISIDASHLAQKNQIDVSFGCEQWADYGVNIVITGGEITESYGGD